MLLYLQYGLVIYDLIKSQSAHIQCLIQWQFKMYSQMCEHCGSAQTSIYWLLEGKVGECTKKHSLPCIYFAMQEEITMNQRTMK